MMKIIQAGMSVGFFLCVFVCDTFGLCVIEKNLYISY